MGVEQQSWNGTGYLLKLPYVAQAEISYDDQNWVYDRAGGGEDTEPEGIQAYSKRRG